MDFAFNGTFTNIDVRHHPVDFNLASLIDRPLFTPETGVTVVGKDD